jgi:hypothetical protein
MKTEDIMLKGNTAIGDHNAFTAKVLQVKT